MVEKIVEEIEKEIIELQNKIENTDNFIWKDPMYIDISEENKFLIKQQWYIMAIYMNILKRRLKLFKNRGEQ